MQIVRKMKEEDVAAVAALEQATFADAWSAQGIRDTLCQSQAYILVAELDEKIVGYCIVYHVLDEAEIARIAVDSSRRNQGVGHCLMDAVTEECKTNGITRILLDVRESNDSARSFYSHYGFKEDGIRKDFYECPREHAVLMSMPTVSTRNA